MTSKPLTIIVSALAQGGSRTSEDAIPTARSPRPAMARHDEAKFRARDGRFLAMGGEPVEADPWS